MSGRLPLAQACDRFRVRRSVYPKAMVDPELGDRICSGEVPRRLRGLGMTLKEASTHNVRN